MTTAFSMPGAPTICRVARVQLNAGLEMWARIEPRLSRAREYLRAPVEPASLAAFRALFGVVMGVAALRFLAKGWVRELLVEPSFHFTYPAFEFVRPWSLFGMELHQLALALLAFAVAVGFHTRLAAAAYFVGFTYVELIDQALYLNHYYLVSLLAALIAALPFGRFYSVDAWRQPGRRLGEVPRWVLLVVRLQVGVVYFYAGVAKLNQDWLFEAAPLRLWLPARSDLPLVGWLLEYPTTAYVASWVGALFDLSIVFLLSWRRTRAVAFALVVAFHSMTGILFPIGIFPWVMTCAATLFFAPDWPLRLVGRQTVWESPNVRPPGHAAANAPSERYSAPGAFGWLIALHCALQVALPLRQFFERQPSAWTLDGFNFAWNVMLVEKSGHVTFRARDRLSGRIEEVEPKTFLRRFQEIAMAQDPALVRQAALEVAKQMRARGREVAVYADAIASLNGRPAQALVDPNVDLTGELPSSWIVPLR
ncbi:MAG TPA: HTTM domain-containing protein [Polyangiaceae bacterium]|nr:HTTM domain-containing protein [Polyangiaceae bacterium]